MIGGNTYATIKQKATTSTINAIGERITGWVDLVSVRGFMDLSSGDSSYTYNAKLQESTHVFICDYIPVDRKPENKRLIHNNEAYDVLLIDDPMELHQHLEIYLKKVV